MAAWVMNAEALAEVDRERCIRTHAPKLYFRVSDLRRVYGLSPSHAYKLASVHKWRKVRVLGLTWYLIADVEAWNSRRSESR